MESETFKKHYLLVSDSNEKGNQFDTKKLSWDNLVDMAQDSLFNSYLDIMDRYLTRNQIVSGKNDLEWKMNLQKDAFA
jgi:hypothetical protein